MEVDVIGSQRRWVIGVVGLALLMLAPSVAKAATFTVTTTTDPVPGGCSPGDCSLREAVLAANLTAAPDKIKLPSR